MTRLLPGILLCIALAGCASYGGSGLRPGVDGAGEIRAAMGEPTTVWPEADGGASWEYPRGPEGRHTFMVRLGPDGRLKAIEQVLDPAHFSRIEVGRSSREDVRRLIGSPWRETPFPRRDELVWSYKYRDVWRWELHVVFNEAGIVKSMFSLDDEPKGADRERD